MDLNVLDPVVKDQMVEEVLLDHAFIPDATSDPHGKQAVCVAAEGLAVDKVTPSSDHLSGYKSKACAVCHGQKGKMTFFRKYEQRQDPGDHSPVDRKSAFP